MNVRPFSFRQRQLLRGLILGQSNKEIGLASGISEGTVKVYMVHLRRKIGSGSRLASALWIRSRQHLLTEPVDIGVPEGAD